MEREEFSFSQFMELWHNYINEFGHNDNAIILDLQEHNFDSNEIDDLVDMIMEPMKPLPRTSWTHFCAYRIDAYKHIDANAEDAYDKMCDVIDEMFNTKFQRTSMPSTFGGDERDDLLVQILDWMAKL